MSRRAALAASLCLAAAARAEVVYVDIDALPGGDGLSWATAFDHPQDAVAPGAEIWVAEGTYARRADADTVVVDMQPSVSMYGGFNGTETLRDERDWVLHPTILDGEDVCQHVVFFSGDMGARLDGFTVKRGDARLASPLPWGGGVWVQDSNFSTIANCTIESNRGAYGGAIGCRMSSVTVTGCTFHMNQADAYGGGLYLDMGPGSVALSGCTFTSNTASFGGAVCNRGGQLNPTGCTFQGNSAGSGGALMLDGATPATATGCTFAGNSATAMGGAVLNYSDDFTATSCTFSGNTAASGGAIYTNYFAVTTRTTNCTFWRNQAAIGGAMCVNGKAATVTNSILYSDTTGSATEIACMSGGSCAVSYSCIEGGYAGAGNFDADPLFVDADGIDDVIGTADDDLRLQAGSPCIDAADGDAAPPLDKDGNLRSDDLSLPDSGVGAPTFVDIGACEFQGQTPGSFVNVLGPAPDDTWRVGRSVMIQWLATSDVTNVRIEIDRNLGAGWELLLASTQNDRAEQWIVSDGGQTLPQTGCRIRILDADDDVPLGISGAFTIFGGTWYVDVDAAADGDGITWGTALQHPQEAMDRAASGEEIWVAEGTYTRLTPGHIFVLNMIDGVAVYGGFLGSETARDQRDWRARETILDAEQLCYRAASGASNVVFDGFTLKRGWAAGAGSPLDRGAGIYFRQAANVTVANCTFTENYAGMSGGGLYLENVTTATVSDCVFMYNSGRSGGAVYVGLSPAVTIANCVFYGNSAELVAGAAYCSGAATAAALANCTFHGNSALLNQGGAVYANSSATVNVRNCVLWGDSAPTGDEIYQDTGGTVSVGYSCIEGGWPGAGNTIANPIFVDPLNGDLHLQPGSPCIDSADGNVAPAQDIEGLDRHDDVGTVDSGIGTPTYADMGAYEFQGTTPPVWLTVLAPELGEGWAVGRIYAIRWASSGGFPAVKIELFRQCSGWETIVPTTANNGLFYWPANAGGYALPQRDCLIRVSESTGAGPSDTSEGFVIFSGDWYVDIDAPAGGDGFTWHTAFRNPQEAVEAAVAGDTVRVAAGTYASLQGPGEPLLDISAAVNFYGGYAGYGEADPDERDPDRFPAVLDGENAAYPVVRILANCVFDGFTVTRSADFGMYCRDTPSLRVTNCRFTANADVALWSLNVDNYAVAGCTFNGNLGTALYASQCNGTVSDCAFSDNSDTALQMYYIGSFYGCAMTITRCSFTGNAGSSGGGMRLQSSPDVAVTDCEFHANSASFYGGGISLDSSSCSIADCVFAGNTSAWDGGGVYFDYGTPSIDRCVFSDNTAQGSGGGAYAHYDNTQPVLTNCTFLGNTAVTGMGGGIAVDWEASADLMNCTFSGNTAVNGGAVGLDTVFSDPTDVVLTNSILWGDSATSGNEIYLAELACTATVTYSCVEGPLWPGAGNLNVDPAFVAPAIGNVRLGTGSPCIDRATPTGAPADDLDGNARPYDLGYDMGAFEWQGGGPVTWYVKPGGTGDGSSWPLALGNPQEALAAASSGDDIWVAEGTYLPTTSDPDPRKATFALTGGVAMYGGFAGTEAAQDERDPVAHVTTLSGDIDERASREESPGEAQPARLVHDVEDIVAHERLAAGDDQEHHAEARHGCQEVPGFLGGEVGPLGPVG